MIEAILTLPILMFVALSALPIIEYFDRATEAALISREAANRALQECGSPVPPEDLLNQGQVDELWRQACLDEVLEQLDFPIGNRLEQAQLVIKVFECSNFACNPGCSSPDHGCCDCIGAVNEFASSKVLDESGANRGTESDPQDPAYSHFSAGNFGPGGSLRHLITSRRTVATAEVRARFFAMPDMVPVISVDQSTIY